MHTDFTIVGPKPHLGVFIFCKVSASHRSNVEHDRGVVRQLRGEVVGVVQGSLDGETWKKAPAAGTQIQTHVHQEDENKVLRQVDRCVALHPRSSHSTAAFLRGGSSNPGSHGREGILSMTLEKRCRITWRPSTKHCRWIAGQAGWTNGTTWRDKKARRMRLEETSKKRAQA